MKNLNFKISNPSESINSMLGFKNFYTYKDSISNLPARSSYIPKISFLENVMSKTPQPVNIEGVYEDIISGTYKEQIEAIRTTVDFSERRDLKKKLPAIMFGGTFLNDRLTVSEASKLVCIDFDHVEDLKRLISRFKFCSYVYMYFVSPSGDGLKLIVRTNAQTDEEYKEEINKLFQYFKKLGLNPDTTKQNINDLCFYSYDPKAFLNIYAKVWNEIDYDFPKIPGDDRIIESLEHIINQIEKKKIDLTDGGDIYWDLGVGFANKFGEKGREYFHKVCCNRSDYDYEKWETEYDDCLNCCEFGDISTFFLLTFNHNIEILPKSINLRGDRIQNPKYAGLPLNKENLLKATDGGMLAYKLVIPNLRGGGKKKHNLKNPFYKDTRGSLSLYFQNDRWYFRDYGSMDFSGDIFDFMQYYYKLSSWKDFYKILININRDLDLGLVESGKKEEKPDFVYNPESSDENQYQVYYKTLFSKDELDYWNQYGIFEGTLSEYRVKSVSKYKLITPEGKSFTFYSNRENPIFAYVFSDKLVKIYKPFDTEFKFFWIGKKDVSEIFGLRPIYTNKPDVSRPMIITGGEKDVMALSYFDCYACCFNSETSFDEEFIKELKETFGSVLVLYDTDETGVEASKYLEEKFNLQSIHLPEDVLGDKGKDISDYIALDGSVEVLFELIDEAEKSYKEKNEALNCNSSASEPEDNEKNDIQ